MQVFQTSPFFGGGLETRLVKIRQPTTIVQPISPLLQQVQGQTTQVECIGNNLAQMGMLTAELIVHTYFTSLHPSSIMSNDSRETQVTMEEPSCTQEMVNEQQHEFLYPIGNDTNISLPHVHTFAVNVDSLLNHIRTALLRFQLELTQLKTLTTIYTVPTHTSI